MASSSCETVKISKFSSFTGWYLYFTFANHGDYSVYALEQVNETVMATGGDDQRIFIWQLIDGLVLTQINASDVVYSLRILSDGITLAAGLQCGCINIYNVAGIIILSFSINLSEKFRFVESWSPMGLNMKIFHHLKQWENFYLVRKNSI